MAHDDDVRDAQVLDDGDIAALLARYDAVIVPLCIAKLRGAAEAEDVAQDVRVRLLEEFRRGKRYGGTPYRVVVHNVIRWTVADHFAGRPTDVPLPERWEPSEAGHADEVVAVYSLEQLFDGLPERERQVATLRYLDALDPPEIAARLGMEPNNVHQALHRAHGRLRERVGRG